MPVDCNMTAAFRLFACKNYNAGTVAGVPVAVILR